MKSATVFAKYIYNQVIDSPLSIQKLLYISFGFFGAYHNEFLFEDYIETWKYGSVIPDAYYMFRNSPKEFADLKPLLEADQKTIINMV